MSEDSELKLYESQIIECHKTIQDYFKNIKKKHTKHHYYPDNVSSYINSILGIEKTYSFNGIHTDKFNVFNHSNNLRSIYNEETYTGMNPFIIMVCFPLSGLRFDVKLSDIDKWPCIKPILNGGFSEKLIQLKYFDKRSNSIINGAKLLILTLPINSIILEINNVKVNYNTNVFDVSGNNIETYISNNNGTTETTATNETTGTAENVFIKKTFVPLDELIYIQDHQTWI